jgi:hypothetical protein
MTTKKSLLSLFFLFLAAVLSLTPAASADSLNFSLAQPVQVALPGSTLSFTATVTAPSTNGAAIFLNGDSDNVDSPLSLDDSGFFGSFPFFLNPGDSFIGTLFTIMVPKFTNQGAYTGFFSILGGSDDGASNVLGTVNFTVYAVPEPSTILLFSTGLSSFGLMARRLRRS